jgi:hypothetical protein
MKCALILMLLATSSLHAASTKSDKMMKPMTMTTEQRQNMATAHENMAACLKSDKSLDVCHTEMMDSCKATMGDEGCPMGMMKHDMMKKRK